MAHARDFGDTVRSGRRRRGNDDSAAIDPQTAALLIIDVTNFDAHPEHGFARFAREEEIDLSYYWDRVESPMMPNLGTLLKGFRSARSRVVHVRVGAQFDDYADSQSHFRDVHRRSGALRGTLEFDVREELAPQLGEAVIDKVGASAFTTGSADVVLRNAGVEQVVVCGVVTNGCVIASAISAWDLGYEVMVVEDGCAGGDPEVHSSAINVMRSMGMTIASTAEVVDQLTRALEPANALH
jgi:nicotinamidase-related amidase